MVIGNYRITIVNFLKGINTTKWYSFALFDSSITVDDIALCDTSVGYQVAKVIDIVEQLDYNGADVTKEIICKVDFSNFQKRIEERKRKVELKAKMDAMVKDNKELMPYQMLAVAEKNPVIKEILDEYTNINV